MTSESWAPNQRQDLLLIGDSIVWGGEEYKHEEKLGPSLQVCLPAWSVWSVGASSWSIPNEVEYLRRNPEVVEATELVIWVLNSGDFLSKTQFLTDANTPRSRPWSANLYAIRKYILPTGFKKWMRGALNRIWPPTEAGPSDPTAAQQELTEAVDALSAKGKPILILAYPSLAELSSFRLNGNGEGSEFEALLARLEKIRNPNLRIVDGRSLSSWGPGDYQDHIHPTPEGNRRLAKAVADMVERSKRPTY